MLPSTGYFNSINCPFYDSSLCERPYCHFRHVRKESQHSVNENGENLQKLVSASVLNALPNSEAATNTTNSYASDNPSEIAQNVSAPLKVTYNPTPISKLNKINNSDTENNEEFNEQKKRHIPVPYTPRKPISLPIKRTVDCDDFKPFIYNPGSTDTTKLDPYTPKGSVESKEKYLPGTEVIVPEYAPNDSNQQSVNKRSYVPSDKSVNKKKVLEYEPAKVTSKSEIPFLTYQPTPRSLVPCFSSDEEEVPEIKKQKLNNELNGLDELGAEFDILDQILDEENKAEIKSNQKNENKDLNKNKAKDKIDNKTSKTVKESKSNSEKDRKKNDRIKSDKKDKPAEKHDSKSKSSHKKSSHKSSSREKEKDTKHKDKEKDKHSKERSSDSKKHSTSKSSNKDLKEKDSNHSKKSSKHSSSREKDSKKRERDKSKHKSHKSSKVRDKNSKKKEKKSNGVSENEDTMDINLTIDEQYEVSSESDEEAIALECKKIFEEYVPSEKPEVIEHHIKCDDPNESEYNIGKKRVSRAADKNIKVATKQPIKPDYKVSAAQAMAERLSKVREYHVAKKAAEILKNESEAKVDTSKIIPPTPGGSSKIRIAHVPYASTLLTAKKTISSTPKPLKLEPSTSTTITQTIKKGEKRVAHIPSEKFIDRPGVLEPLASKIPANIRTTYLNMMIDECIKIYLCPTDAYARAQHEELATSKKCSTVQIYKNSAVLAISRLRKELQECKGVKKSGSDCSVLQKTPQTIMGTSGNAGSWSIETKNKKFIDNKEFRGAKLYENIKKWVLTEEKLQENGFPRPHASGEKGRAIIYGQNKQKPPVGFIRTCCRCKKSYTVNKKGFPAVMEECIYHPNNKYRVRGEAKYQCCSQDASSDGCCVAPTHVYEYVDFENLKGYVKTLPPERTMETYGVYSLDCEMCYTTQGLDLTRVTVIDSDCKVVYETLIKPLHPIIDYNTRYSGITEEQMANVKTTLLDVQATLLTMFNSKTILIGHSLESDFKALKLIHDTVIDTSVLYPHKMGPPYKRALRNLSSEHLKKIIQNSIDGHDSAEDATVCMELIHYKLKEDLKTR